MKRKGKKIQIIFESYVFLNPFLKEKYRRLARVVVNFLMKKDRMEVEVPSVDVITMGWLQPQSLASLSWMSDSHNHN